jgi:hypothetical protein
MDTIKSFVKRIRVRLWPFVAALLAALPYVLDYVGMLDLRPIMIYLFGEDRGALMTPLLVLVLAILKPAIHLEPEED